MSMQFFGKIRLLADRLRDGADPRDIRGLCYIAGEHESEQKRLA